MTAMRFDGLPFRPDRLPADLRDLVPLLSPWAVADDVDRGERIAAASDDDLRRLGGAVTPYLAAINRFCDEHEDDVDAYEAPLLGALAEAAVEAGLELERRAAPPAATRDCARCGGEGLRWRAHPEGGRIPILCPECHGTGRVRA